MLAITRRRPLWQGVSQTESDLEKLRPETNPWQENSPDPLDSPFKPFSQVRTPVVVAIPQSATLTGVSTTLSERRLLVPLGAALLLLTGFVLWQTLITFNEFKGVISPTPDVVHLGSNSIPTTSGETANSNAFPSGTALQPGGPYTGTGGPEPATPTNLTSTP